MAIFPHKDLRLMVGVLLLAIVVIALALCFGLISGSTKIVIVILLLITIAVCVDTFSLTKQTIILEEDSVSLKNTLTHYSVNIPWKELRCGYYVCTSKGRKYMILSTRELTSSVQKKYLRESTRLMSQFLNRSKNKEYLCFSIESSSSKEILPLIPTHIAIQEDNLYKS